MNSNPFRKKQTHDLWYVTITVTIYVTFSFFVDIDNLIT